MRTRLIQLVLFILTLATTTAAGAEWMFGRPLLPTEGVKSLGWPEFLAGLQYSLPFLGVLTVHEFGHYVVARLNRVRVTLPYYLPFWLGGGMTFGTLGAFIRIKDYIDSRRVYFDVGIAGPLAGFVVAVGVLWYGFTHLPPADYIFTIHPEYRKYGMYFGQYVYKNLAQQGGAIALGDNVLFWFFKTYVADPHRLPHPYEIIHYPYLLAGYFSLFFTALNLIPIGQLDGGHVLYALIGRRRFQYVAPTLFIIFVFYAGLGLFKPADFATDGNAFWAQMGNLALYVFLLFIACSRLTSNTERLAPQTALLVALSIVLGQLALTWWQPTLEGYPGFLLFAFLLGRFLGVQHPDTTFDEPLSTGRKVLGWLALLVFLLCFSPKPFQIIGGA